MAILLFFPRLLRILKWVPLFDERWGLTYCLFSGEGPVTYSTDSSRLFFPSLHIEYFHSENLRQYNYSFRPVQYIKLLLAVASTVVPGFAPRRDSRKNFCSSQDRLYICKFQPTFGRDEGSVFLSRRHICCTVIQHECTRTHAASGKGYLQFMGAIRALSLR
jgi:hypothetical protein